MHWILWATTLTAVLVSLACSWRRTLTALGAAIKRMGKIAPLFVMVMAMFALSVTLIPDSIIRSTIGADSGPTGLALATAIGSLAVMPGFVAFPLCAALLRQSVPYFILAGFSTALMNIGIATFPLECRYLGWKVTVVRNGIGLVVTLIVALVIGLAFGEIPRPW